MNVEVLMKVEDTSATWRQPNVSTRSVLTNVSVNLDSGLTSLIIDSVQVRNHKHLEHVRIIKEKTTIRV